MTETRRHDARSLLCDALEELGGPLIVLDETLRIVAATPLAEALLAIDVPLGVRAPRVLCGGSDERPIAEALAAGRPIRAAVVRPRPDGGQQRIWVRTLRLRARDERGGGWIVLLEAGEEDATEDQAVLFHGLWSAEPVMKRVFELIRKVARAEATVLIRGETGSGKERVAHAVHALSPRASGPFHAINCAALPPMLLESELFGHVRGAFTGAVRDMPGHFQATHGGTLFLDEIAEMPLELQAKLLRVIETRTVIPVGQRDPIPVDVRIVCATHRSLRAEAEAGRFRSDLMYRLRVIPIFLPPLRERPRDIPLLVEKFLAARNERGERKITRVAPGAMALLLHHSWPGNVRELHNVIEYAYVVGSGPTLVETDLPPELYDPGAPGQPEAVNAPPPLEEAAEAKRIRRALERTGGNRQQAAHILGMSRITLWRHMRRLGLESS